MNGLPHTGSSSCWGDLRPLGLDLFNKDWPLFICYLAGHAALSGDEGPLLDKLWRLKPPPGQAAWEWDTFMSYIQTEAEVFTLPPPI